MTSSVVEQYRQSLSLYSTDLLEATATRATRYHRANRKSDPTERIEKALLAKRSSERLIADLQPEEREALAILLRIPTMLWRWDHAVRLLDANGIDSSYHVLQHLLTEGLLYMLRPRSTEPLARFHVSDAVHAEELPSVAVAGVLAHRDLGLPTLNESKVGAPGERWRHADGWELIVRLAVLWRLAWRAPIKQTQQRRLFKRDHQRIAESSLLAAPLLDAPSHIEQIGTMIYQLADKLDWFVETENGRSPRGLLSDIWMQGLGDVLLECAKALLALDRWNELGDLTPAGPFAGEMCSARALLLLWLAELRDGDGYTTADLAARLQEVHPPWNGQGEIIGALRDVESRRELARQWVDRWLLGPAYQCGLTGVGTSADGHIVVRLSDLGRRFLNAADELPAQPDYPQTMLVQPNHEIIIFRQGLSIPLLCQLVLFAEPKSVGAALAFEINATSIYAALEAGLDVDAIIDLMQRHSGRALPSGLVESIHTWAQKRDRISVYSNASLLEFSSEEDLAEAVARGLDGQPITDRILLVPADQARNLKNLRITASRDYRLEIDQCVNTDEDGITLIVDLSKSDLMLESELRRFADPVEDTGVQQGERFRVTAESLARAFDQGINASFLEEWYRRRTGASPPASVFLLMQAVRGLKLSIGELVVVQTPGPLITAGLLQHPQTADCIDHELGPNAVSVPAERLAQLRTHLETLGIELDEAP